MKFRVYVSEMDDITTGYITGDMLEEAERYQEFFSENDEHGTGFFEIDLPNIDESESSSVSAQFEAERIQFGSYDPEGWRPISEFCRIDNDGCTVVFDRMILYYVYDSMEMDDYDRVMSYEDAVGRIHPDDIDLFEDLFEQYREEQKVDD